MCQIQVQRHHHCRVIDICALVVGAIHDPPIPVQPLEPLVLLQMESRLEWATAGDILGGWQKHEFGNEIASSLHCNSVEHYLSVAIGT